MDGTPLIRSRAPSTLKSNATVLMPANRRPTFINIPPRFQGGPRKRLGYSEFGATHAWNYTCVFFHGTSGSSKQAGFLHEAARRLSIRIVAFDRPGIGMSSSGAFQDSTQGCAAEFNVQTLNVRSRTLSTKWHTLFGNYKFETFS